MYLGSRLIVSEIGVGRARGPRFLACVRPGVVVLVTAAAIALEQRHWGAVVSQTLGRDWLRVSIGAPNCTRGSSKRVLEERGVGVIVDLTHDDPISRLRRNGPSKRPSAELGIAHHRFPLGGSGLGDIDHYADAIEVIAEARKSGNPVLVHCSAGARRAGGVVASYQVLVEGKGSEAAYAELDRYGRIPVAETPLVAYLNQNMEILAEELVSRGVIDHAPRPLPVFVPPD